MIFRCQFFPGARNAAGFMIILCSFFGPPVLAESTLLDPVIALINKGEYSRALSHLEPLLLLQPDHLYGRFQRARALIAIGDQEAAQRLLINLLADYGRGPEIYNNLAVIYASQGEFEHARQQLELAIATDPEYKRVYDNLTVVYERLASQAYREALSPDEEVDLPVSQLAVIERLQREKVVENVAQKAEKQELTVTPKQDKALIKSMINSWAQAWSQQQPVRYLSYYAAQFKPSSGMSRQDWAAKRHIRLKAPQYIRVEVDRVDITRIDNRVANVILRQHYTSNRMNDTVIKSLIVKKEQGQWRIFQEYLIR